MDLYRRLRRHGYSDDANLLSVNSYGETVRSLRKNAEQAGDGNADERVRLNLELFTGVAIPLSFC